MNLTLFLTFEPQVGLRMLQAQELNKKIVHKLFNEKKQIRVCLQEISKK